MAGNTDKRLLKIAFDAKRITHNATGLGNYGRTVVQNLARFAPDICCQLWSPDEGCAELRNRMAAIPNVEFRYPRTPKHGIFKALWRSFGITRELDSDTALFHGLSAELPSGLRKAGIASVVTVHDLIFLRYPRYYKTIDRLLYTRKYKKACREADRIIAISEATKRDIVDFFGIAPDKIDVVYQGCDEQFKHPVPEQRKQEVVKKYALPERFALSVGSIEERKNLLAALKAIELSTSDLHLVAVGKRTPYTEVVERYAAEHGLSGRLHILPAVEFADLPAIYQSAAVFIYPSRFEGFGIPMIEAAHCGVPTIGATGSCLEEAGGPTALYADPDDAEAIARHIDNILADSTLRRRMIDGGREYVRRFEPDVLVAELLKVYQLAIRNSLLIANC